MNSPQQREEQNRATLNLPKNLGMRSKLSQLLELKENEQNQQTMNAALVELGLLDPEDTDWAVKPWADKIAAIKEILVMVEKAITQADPAAVTALTLKVGESAKTVAQTQETENIPGFEKIEALARAQYQDAVALLIKNGLHNPEDPEGLVPILTLDETIARLKKLCTLERIEEIAKFKEPVLQLISPKSFEDHVEAIDAHRNPKLKQVHTFASNESKNRGVVADEKQGNQWLVAIVDGPQETAAPQFVKNNERLTNRQVVESWYARMAPKGIQTVSPKSAALLQMKGIGENKPMDPRTWTVVDNGRLLEDLSNGSFLPNAGWNEVQVRFVGYDPVDQDGALRLRPSVMG